MRTGLLVRDPPLSTDPVEDGGNVCHPAVRDRSIFWPVCLLAVCCVSCLLLLRLLQTAKRSIYIHHFVPLGFVHRQQTKTLGRERRSDLHWTFCVQRFLVTLADHTFSFRIDAATSAAVLLCVVVW